MYTLLMILAWVAIISGLLAITLYIIGFILVIIWAAMDRD